LGSPGLLVLGFARAVRAWICPGLCVLGPGCGWLRVLRCVNCPSRGGTQLTGGRGRYDDTAWACRCQRTTGLRCEWIVDLLAGRTVHLLVREPTDHPVVPVQGHPSSSGGAEAYPGAKVREAGARAAVRLELELGPACGWNSSSGRPAAGARAAVEVSRGRGGVVRAITDADDPGRGG
jgi:hypothetical protein